MNMGLSGVSWDSYWDNPQMMIRWSGDNGSQEAANCQAMQFWWLQKWWLLGKNMVARNLMPIYIYIVIYIYSNIYIFIYIYLQITPNHRCSYQNGCFEVPQHQCVLVRQLIVITDAWLSFQSQIQGGTVLLCRLNPQRSDFKTKWCNLYMSWPTCVVRIRCTLRVIECTKNIQQTKLNPPG